MEGLQLLGFDPKKIRASAAVKEEMDRLLTYMHLPSPCHHLCAPLSCHCIRVALLNANSARLHFQDITADPVLMNSDIVALTETHITEYHQMRNYTLLMKQRITMVLPCMYQKLPSKVSSFAYHGWYRSSLC